MPQPKKRSPSKSTRKPSKTTTSRRTTKAKASRAPKSKDFQEARTRAERLLRDPDAAQRLADEAEKKANRKKRGNLGKVIEETKALIRLVRAYAKGEYRAVALESMVLVVAAVVYLVSPLDLIPDFLPGGLLDDAAIVAFVVGMVQSELQEFMDWEKEQTAAAAQS